MEDNYLNHMKNQFGKILNCLPLYHSDLPCMRDRYILLLCRNAQNRIGRDLHNRVRDQKLVSCPLESGSHFLLQRLDLNKMKV